MAKREGEYLLGTEQAELQRLGFQHQIWQMETHSLWRRAAFGPGQVLADLGSGPGFATLDLARLVGPSGQVFAVEAASRYVVYLNSVLECLPELAGVVRSELGDVGEIPIGNASVDGAFVRWLLCFLKKPETALAEIARILKPGGRVVIMDYFNYLAAKVVPEQPALNSVFQAYYRSAKDYGGSYDVGNTIPSWLIRAGFQLEDVQPICKIGRPGSIWWQWVASFHQVFVPKLVELGIWESAEREAFEQAWEKAAENPGSMLFTPPMVGIVARKR